MAEEMEELHVEGLAIHDDPEPCVDVPRGRGEALVGARAGQAIEPRNESFGVPTLSKGVEGNTAGDVSASRRAQQALADAGFERSLKSTSRYLEGLLEQGRLSVELASENGHKPGRRFTVAPDGDQRAACEVETPSRSSMSTRQVRGRVTAELGEDRQLQA